MKMLLILYYRTFRYLKYALNGIFFILFATRRINDGDG